MGPQGLLENLGKTKVLNAGLTYGYVPAAVILAQRKSDYQKIGGYLQSTVPYNLWPFKSCKEKGSQNWMKWTIAVSWGDGIILHESRVPTSEKVITKKQEATYKTCDHVKKKEVTIGWNEPLEDRQKVWDFSPWVTSNNYSFVILWIMKVLLYSIENIEL